MELPVVVLGGGPAGLATAIGLSQRGIGPVIVVEAGDYTGPRLGETLVPDARLVLRQLGVDAASICEGQGVCPGSCSIWGGEQPGFNDFLLNPHGRGWHLDRRRFDLALADLARGRGAAIRLRTRLERLAPAAGAGFHLTLRGGGGPEQLRAGFVVDASGQRGLAARALGARPLHHDRLSFLVATLDAPADAPLTRLTLLEAVEYGWWYAALLPESRVVVGLATDPEILRGEALHRPDRWRSRLSETRLLSGELAGCAMRAPPTATTARSFRLDRAAGAGWLAAGDAASACDPLSSQGICKALTDGLEAARAIADWAAGDRSAPERYAAGVEARFGDYLWSRNVLYAQEQRWPDAPFWARRHASTALRRPDPRTGGASGA